MIKIGITGSLASGKTTASKILSFKRGPLFSADLVVKKLYKKQYFIKKIKNLFKIKGSQNLKNTLKSKILKKSSNLLILEKIIHPIVRKEMIKFKKRNKKSKLLFFEIPLLIESKLMHHFDIIIFIKARKNTRLKRFISKGGNKNLFKILDKKQLADIKKIKFCDHVIVNERNLNILKKNLLDIIDNYV